MTNFPRSLVGALALCAALGCGGDPSQPATPASSPASTGAEQTSHKAAFDRAHHMQASLWLAISARESLIDGDLDEAKNAARALATHDYEGSIPESWKPWIGEMQKQAGELTVAGGIEDASQSLAALALSCGNCHYHKGAGPSVAHEPPVAWGPGPDTLDERMARHAEGAEQMWIGLVEPSNEAWRSGTITLTRAPLAPPVSGDGAVDARSAQAVERIRGLAKRARTAATYPERGQIFGQLIATCGSCHTTTPRSP